MLKENSVFIFLLLLFVLFFCRQVVTTDAEGNAREVFVVKRTKKHSSKKSKEKICENFIQQIGRSPSVRKKIAKIDKVLLRETQRYLESEKDSLIKGAKKENIASLLERSDRFLEKMEAFCNDCEQYLDFLKSQV